MPESFTKTQERKERRKELYASVSKFKRVLDDYYILKTWDDWLVFDEWARLAYPYNVRSRWGPNPDDLPVAITYDMYYASCGPDYVDYEYYTLDNAKVLLANVQAMCDALS